MKKPLLIILLALSSLIWSWDNSLTDENILIKEYEEDEFKKTFDSDFTPGIFIDSEIKDISILVNGNKYRSDKLFLQDLSPGNYHIKLNKGGYKSIELWITFNENRYIHIDATLERERGYLMVNTQLENYELYIDSQRIDISNPLPTGGYNLTIRSFGYEEQTSYITIFDNTTTQIDYNPSKVDFQLQQVSINKEIINPLAKGSFNRLKVTIRVNAPGKAILEYLNRDNSIIKSEEIEFTNWDTDIVVNGFLDNKKLDNGQYKVRVKTDSKSLTNTFTVLDTIYISKSGLNLSDTGEYYNLDISQTGFSIGRDFPNSKTQIKLNHIKNSYFGVGLFAFMDLTLWENNSDINLQGGFYKGFNFSIIGLKPSFSYKFRLENKDSSTENFHNILLNIPGTVSLGSWGITLNPGLSYEFGSDLYTTGTFGIDWDNQLIKTGISGGIKTEDFKELNFKYGGEFNYLLNNSQSYLGIAVTGDLDLNFQTDLSISLIY